MLRGRDRVEISLVMLTAFQQRSVSRFRRDPCQVATTLHNPSCASSVKGNLEVFDQERDLYARRQSH